MIIAFHSYKGGVGRSVTLANVATILALKGRKVGCIDLDVEAPGLHIIFGIKDIEENSSLLNLLKNKHTSLPRNAIKEVQLKNKRSSSPGSIYLLPTINNPSILDTLIWDVEIQNTLKSLIDSFCNRYNLDDLLIDVRTGISGTAPLAYLIADKIIILLRLGEQNLKGTKRLKDSLKVLGKEVIIVPCAVPSSNKAIKFIKETALALEIKQFSCVLHYDEDLALKEEITVFKTIKRKISEEYKKLASVILK